MIRTTPTFRMPTLRLVGTLLILAALAGLPTSAWAEFRIGVWQPGGHDRTDVSFTAATATDLDALGVDLLINTPNQVGNQLGQPDYGGYQDFEENILSLWNNTVPEPNGPRGFVVQHAPEGHSRRGYHWKLERYAGSLCDTRETNRDRALHNPMWLNESNDLGEATGLLWNKWRTYPGFYGYRIGHETDYCGGIYDSRTYDNMSTVINSIRAHDTEHRIIAVGNTLDTRWTGHEQTAFRQNFFRPNTIPGGPDPSPANIFMQEVYILADGDVSEDDVQDEFDYLRNGLDSIGTMVDLALSDNRKAEWHFIVQVTRTNRDMTSTRPPQSGLYRHPTLPELKAQVNMALSRGAKGVTYFTYTSSNGYVGGPGGDEYEGLVELDRSRNPSIWDTVQTVNGTLRILGDALYPLTWDAGFGTDPLPNSMLVNEVRPSADHAATAGSLEFGVFHDDEADYVLVVNRHNLTTGGSQTIDLRFDTQQMQTNRATGGSYRVKEIVSNRESAYVADASNHIWVPQQILAPGDARLYRIERAEVPDAPQNPRAAARNDGGIGLNWDRVSTIPAVSKYQVQYQRVQVGSEVWSDYVHQATVFHARNTFYNHRNDAAGYPLHPGYRYRYRVRAHNAEGAGLWAEEFPTDGAIVLANAPGLAGLVLDDESVGLVANWTCPNYGFCAPSAVRQIAPLQLTAEIKSGSAEEWSAVEATVSGLQTTHSVGGLSRRVVHQFQTRAVNANDEAGWASKAVAVVPLQMQAGTGDDEVDLNWDAPTGYGVLAWQYRYKATDSATWGGWQGVSPSGATSQTVSGLTNGVNYQFQVQAVSGGMARAVSFIESAPAGNDSPISPESGTTEKATVGQYFSFTRPAFSGGAAPLTYSVSGSCPGLTATSSSVSGSPSLAGQCRFTWTATDNDGDTGTYGLLIIVEDDTSPVFPPSETAEAIVGQLFFFTRHPAIGGDAPLTYSVSGSCAGLRVTTSSVSGVSSSAEPCTITWTVTDNDGDTDTFSLQITVDADTSPVFPEPETADAIRGQYFSFTRPAAEGGNAPLTYSVSGSCPGLSATSSSVSGSPTSTGDCTITWTVRDTDGDTDTYSLQISVSDPDTSPVLPSLGTAEATVGQYFSFTRPAAEGGNAPLTYSVSGSCPGLTATSSSVSGAPTSPGEYAIAWTVTDDDGDTYTASLLISVSADTPPDDTSPVLPSLGTAEATVGQYFSFTRPAAEGGNAPLTYSVSGSCPGLTATSSSVSGAPTSPGEYAITWTVTDDDGDTYTASLLISVSAADTSPVFPEPDTAETIVGQYFSFTRPAAEGGNAPLTYSVSGSCAGLTATSSSVSGSPSSTGQCGFTWTVTDNDNDTDTYSLQISVGSASDPMPVFNPSSSSESATVGQYFSFTRPAAEGGNAPLSYSVSGSCAGLTATSSSVSGSPSSTGQCGFTWTVRDNDGDTDTYSLQISVGSASDPMPSFSSSGTSRSATVGQYFSFTRPSASGGNAPLSYSVSGSCAGLTANSSSVSGSPSSTGQCGFTWTVRDNDGDTDTYSLQISVSAADTSPSFSSSGTSRSATVGQYFSFTRPSASGGNAPLSYSVSGSCAGLTANSSSVSGSPSSTGQCGFTWTVRDNDGDTDTYSLQISVGSASDPMPSFSSSGTSRSATVGQYFSFTRPSASGGNAPLSYSVSGSCAGLTANSSSVSGSPSSTGQCGFTWTVRDTDGDTDTFSLQISVSAADTSPSFSSSGTSRSATVGQYFSFSRPSASGGNAPLSYSVSGSCAGLTATSSSVSGSPSSTGQCGFTWTVRDNDGDTDTYSLQISVSAADTSPSFSSSGTSRSATVGQYFSFTRPSASGGNAPLSYSVSGSCAGLTATSSSVSGSPSSTGQCGFTWTVRDNDGDTDTYSLQISVSAADTSPSFSSSGTSRSATVGQYFSFTRPAASGGYAPLSSYRSLAPVLELDKPIPPLIQLARLARLTNVGVLGRLQTTTETPTSLTRSKSPSPLVTAPLTPHLCSATSVFSNH